MCGRCCLLYGYVFWWRSSIPGKKEKNKIQHDEKHLVFIDPYTSDFLLLYLDLPGANHCEIFHALPSLQHTKWS